MTFIRMIPECKNLCYYEEVTWDKIRNKVIAVNPILANIIDEFQPSKNHTFIRACYPFGTNIRDKGKSYFPTENGDLATLNDSATSPNILTKLGYSPSPLALIIDKAVEIYVETPEQRTIPFKLFKPGVIFGVWEVMDQPTVSIRKGWDWSISAGARTLFMLPKISDTISHLRLARTFNIHSYVPRTIFDHHKIFTEIFNSNVKENQWCTELLFFTESWLKPSPKNIGWIKLKEYWTKIAWNQVEYWVNKMVADFNWEAFIAEITKRRIKIRPYLLDTVKHLISIGCETIPGFVTADDSQIIAPTNIFQKAYIEHYMLKDYSPVIMYPDFLWPKSDKKSVYYSLQAPTLPEKPPEHLILPSLLNIIRELKKLMDIYVEVSKNWPKLNFSNTVYDFSENIKLDYFHTENDKYNEIKNIDNLLKLDPDLKNFPKHYKKKSFPENASFFKGCVRISFEP